MFNYLILISILINIILFYFLFKREKIYKGQPSSESPNYPLTYEDDFPNDIPELNSGESVASICANRIRNTIISIEKELGLNPSGNFDTLVERLSKIIDQDGNLKIQGNGDISLAPNPSDHRYRFFVDNEDRFQSLYLSIAISDTYDWQKVLTNKNAEAEQISVERDKKVSLDGFDSNTYISYNGTMIEFYKNGEKVFEL